MYMPLLILLLLSSYCCSVETEPPKIVKDQLEKVHPAIQKAKAEFAKVVKSENDKLIKILEAALTKESKLGNLENAVALKTALEKAKNGDYMDELLRADIADLLGDQGAGRVKLDIDVPGNGFGPKIQAKGKIKITPDAKSKWNSSPSRWLDADYRGHLDVQEKAANGMMYMQLCYKIGDGKLVPINGPVEIEANGILVFGPSDMEGGGSVDNNTGLIKVVVEGSVSLIK